MIGTKYEKDTPRYQFKDKFFFTRYHSYSIGDWSNISGVFEVLKKHYPDVEFKIPSPKLLKSLAPNYMNWSYSPDFDPSTYINLIYDNNPNVELVDEYKGEGVNDHFRAQLDNEVPLAEKILHRFGFSPEELKEEDCTPKLYFTQEELDRVKEITNGEIYGCLLFGSRINNLKGRWEFDTFLYDEAVKYKDYPVFYYSEFDLEGTDWGELFKNKTNFADLKLSLREQLAVKYHAKFNLGYHAGINDAVLGNGKENTILTPYPNFKETHIRNTKYIFPNGDKKYF